MIETILIKFKTARLCKESKYEWFFQFFLIIATDSFQRNHRYLFLAAGPAYTPELIQLRPMYTRLIDHNVGSTYTYVLVHARCEPNSQSWLIKCCRSGLHAPILSPANTPLLQVQPTRSAPPGRLSLVWDGRFTDTIAQLVVARLAVFLVVHCTTLGDTYTVAPLIWSFSRQCGSSTDVSHYDHSILCIPSRVDAGKEV